MRSFLSIIILLFSVPNLVGQDVLKSIRDFSGRQDAELSGYRFDLVGQIMFFCDEHPRRLTIISEEQPRSICFWDPGTNAPTYRNGDLVRIRGTINRATGIHCRQIPEGSKIPLIERLEVIRHAAFPKTVPASPHDINTFRIGNQFVHTDGVLTSVYRDQSNDEWNWLVLKSDSTRVLAAVTERDYPYAELNRLLDAEIRIRGLVHAPGTWWKSHGYHLILFGTDGIETIREAPAPFDTPQFDGTPRDHRQCTIGRVLGTSANKVFLRTNNGYFLPVSPVSDSDFPSLGEQVAAAGFIETTPVCLQMTAAIIRRQSYDVQCVSTIRAMDPERLFTTPAGEKLLDASCFGEVIRIRGRIANSTDGIRTDGKILLECGRRTITVDIRHLLSTMAPDIIGGCTIDVTGICLPEANPDLADQALPQFNGFTLVPRQSADIMVIHHPPWWTPGRLLVVIVLLLLVLLTVGIWNRMLRILSERRGRDLAREQIESARAELQVEERTRLAVELHDSISQTLTGVALQIDAALGSGRNLPAAARFLETARAMLASCRQELRCCIWDLKNRAFEAHDMAEAVAKTLAPHIGNVALQIRFNVPRRLLSESSAHDTLRIIRELVMNAIRHGLAKHIRIAGECRNGLIRFSVRDDGCGFVPANVLGPAQGHFGLQGIRERISGRNGTMEIDSVPGQGSRITVTFVSDERESDEQ